MTEIPLYGKVEEVLASEIAHVEFEPGDRLPVKRNSVYASW
jgi:GntR family transcriptional regulator